MLQVQYVLYYQLAGSGGGNRTTVTIRWAPYFATSDPLYAHHNTGGVCTLIEPVATSVPALDKYGVPHGTPSWIGWGWQPLCEGRSPGDPTGPHYNIEPCAEFLGKKCSGYKYFTGPF